jgi:hypothetical protein
LSQQPTIGVGAWVVHYLGKLTYALIVMIPTNKRLGALAAAGEVDKARILIQKWNYLHAVRTVLDNFLI